jgi:hypothetical protein
MKFNYEKISMDRPEETSPNYTGDDEKLKNERSFEAYDVRPEKEKTATAET